VTAPPDDHQIQPPPQDSELVRDVAGLLVAGAVGALLTGALLRLLHPFGVQARAITLALRLVSRGTSTQPRMIGQTGPVRAQQSEEAYYRAAYLIEAAKRMQISLYADRALPPDEAARNAIRDEERYRQMHERARQNRMAAAVDVAKIASDIGSDLLGWMAHPDDKVTPECLAADGCNFSIDQRPLIGWPGQPHGGTCRCIPVPPYAGRPTVDEATKHLIGV
jgi:hypothetical protein